MILFAYGSLLWSPGFEPVSRSPALVEGWSRSWCVPSTHHRGTPGEPGVVLGLVPGGTCVGELIEVPEGSRRAVAEALARREGAEFGYVAATLPVRTAAGRASALCFVTPALHRPPCERAVETSILRARGASGSNADYALSTIASVAGLPVPRHWPRPCPALSGDAVARLISSSGAPPG